jgi:hypothetical protein
MTARIGEGGHRFALRLPANPLHAKRVSIHERSTPFSHSTGLRFIAEKSFPVANIVETSAEAKSSDDLQLLVTLELRGNERRFLL